MNNIIYNEELVFNKSVKKDADQQWCLDCAVNKLILIIGEALVSYVGWFVSGLELCRRGSGEGVIFFFVLQALIALGTGNFCN